MVIVTGAAGFIGYQVSKALQKTGIGVIGVDELLFFGTRPEHEDVQFAHTYSPEVILDGDFFEEQIKLGKPVTGIIHMGACSDTTEMRVDYLDRVNVQYSQSLWNLATRHKIPFFYASSAATYGSGDIGYDDDESKFSILRPLNPYGESKRKFDLWVISQERAGNTPPAWSGFKFFNVYGFGERHKGKMSSVVLQGFDQIRASQSLKLFKSHRDGIADGEQKRDFIYVEDVVDVLLFALTKPIRRGIYNLGSGKARSYGDLALATFQALKITPKIEFIDTPIAIRDRYQYFTEATMSKLWAEGYQKPFTELEAGVKTTINELAIRSH
jgi:ADP-L-glycero-D-manno-heptose 6-epimerase